MKSENKTIECFDNNQVVLNEIVSEYRQVKTIMNQKYDDDFTVMICNSMCSNNNVNNSIVSICSPMGMHHVLAIELDSKYYILDLTFGKFVKWSKCKVTEYNKNERFYGAPSIFILKNNGLKFMENLLKYGYFECTIENMKLYCDAFVLATYNQNKKLKDLVYTTDISGDEYLSNVILRKMIAPKKFHKTWGC